jgi:hypothetical protein
LSAHLPALCDTLGVYRFASPAFVTDAHLSAAGMAPHERAAFLEAAAGARRSTTSGGVEGGEGGTPRAVTAGDSGEGV